MASPPLPPTTETEGVVNSDDGSKTPVHPQFYHGTQLRNFYWDLRNVDPLPPQPTIPAPVPPQETTLAFGFDEDGERDIFLHTPFKFHTSPPSEELPRQRTYSEVTRSRSCSVFKNGDTVFGGRKIEPPPPPVMAPRPRPLPRAEFPTFPLRSTQVWTKRVRENTANSYPPPKNQKNLRKLKKGCTGRFDCDQCYIPSRIVIPLEIRLKEFTPKLPPTPSSQCPHNFQFTFQVSTLRDADKRQEDKAVAMSENANIVYGETRVAGVSKLLSQEYLNAQDAKVVCDLGMGSGKWLIQAFIEYCNIERVVGWELTPTRFKLATSNLKNFVSHSNNRTAFEWEEKDESILYVTYRDGRLKKNHKPRTIEFNKGNLFECPDIGIADIVYLQTAFYCADFARLCDFLRKMKPGARLCSYKNIETIFQNQNLHELPFDKHPKYGETFEASWFGGQAHMNMYIRKDDRMIGRV